MGYVAVAISIPMKRNEHAELTVLNPGLKNG
jgi:hypothetical protein